MIKFEVKSSGEVVLETSGALWKVIAESAYFIRSIYEELKKKDEDAAEVYKSMLQAAIVVDESPVWNSKE